jgi:metacaspase-1
MRVRKGDWLLAKGETIMATGISINIGLNGVDPSCYNGWDGKLNGCVNDANAMRDLADAQGYDCTLLLDEEATSAAVIKALGGAAAKLKSGDIMVLTYSGHGGQIPDVNGDETDGLDETWALYDRMLVDDELYQMWSHFAAGVRIFMLSDSCHSGTMSKLALYKVLNSPKVMPRDGGPAADAVAVRAMPFTLPAQLFQQNQNMYETLQWAAAKGDRATIGASVLLISGCQDNQLSGDGPQNGVFTGALIKVWSDGQFDGTYETFCKQIQQNMPPTQSPDYYKVGADNPDFEAQRPFTINAESDNSDGDNSGQGSGNNQGAVARPRVEGPTSLSDTDDPPTFTVDQGPNRYYAFEIASQPELFDVEAHQNDRNEGNFYGSWDDNVNNFDSETYTLPEDKWSTLRAADRLYYRVGACASPTGFDDSYVCSVDDLDVLNMPFIEISHDGAPSDAGASDSRKRATSATSKGRPRR